MVKGFVPLIHVDNVVRPEGKTTYGYAPRIGTSDPVSLLMSHSMENEVRDKWWNVQPGDVVLDIGAAYGSYTFSALADGAHVVFAFEPDKGCIFDLLTGALINGVAGRCIVLPVLVGNQIGTTDYWPDQHSSLHHGAGRRRRAIVTVDWFCEQHRLVKVDWIKIDVEGMEVDVLKGAESTLKRCSPKLFIENHVAIIPNVIEDIRKILLPLGYVEENETKGEGTNESWSYWSIKEIANGA